MKLMKLNGLEKVKKVRFNDFSEYDSEKCSNGGCYGFWTDYSLLKNGSWEISYGTTADMDFCPCCGSFGDHYDYDEGKYSCGDFETVTTDELLETINSFEEKDGEYIEFKNSPAKIYVIFGADGHRQRESFNKSWSFETERAAVEIFNSDRTGSNMYTLMQITAKTFEDCLEEFNGQLSDGVFENSRTGEVVEISEDDTLIGGSTEYTIRQAAAGDWCVDVSKYGEEERTYNCFDSIGEAVLFAIKEGAEIKPAL